MAEYYAVERSPEYLAHYGVRGMKWGVRKAIKSGNAARLTRQYAKAQKKLAKLNDRANINKQNAIAKKYGKIAKISGSLGAAGAGLHIGGIYLQKRNWNSFDNRTNALYNELHPRTDSGVWSLTNKGREGFVASNKAASKMYDQHLRAHNAIEVPKYASAVAGAAGLGVGAVTGAKALIAKRRTTTGGHAAAVAKRNEFQREMNKAFAGTRYASKPRHSKNKRK